MAKSLTIARYSLGVGDRFAHQAKAQLRACMLAEEHGAEVIPVWNKSNREHVTIGSDPATTRAAADKAVRELRWQRPYHVDADHIRLETVDRYVPHADFYTIDVADWIGKAADKRAIETFNSSHPDLVGAITITGIERPFRTSTDDISRIAAKYLLATQEAGRIYRHIAAAKGEGKFITEVSMDETDAPQSPVELLVILAALAGERIPLQTIAPKFTGRFNKGVDYVGDVFQFEREFNEDLAVIAFAIRRYGFPAGLKLSVHSGSDKFSIYPAMRRALARFDAGLHIKTAGTTWLEELIGLAESGGEALALAKEVYSESLAHVDELCAPYASVIDIDRAKLPSTQTIQGWSCEQFVAALRHDQANPQYNRHFRQLLHVGYKIAAKFGTRYLDALRGCEAVIARNVTDNLYQRHLKPLFGKNGGGRTTQRPNV